MTISISRDIQRATFIEGLHNTLKKQASQAIIEREKLVHLAGSYVQDGLDEGECIELLMIDGLSREAAESYTSLALFEEEEKEVFDSLGEYSFQFEDAYGKIWSSYDIGEIIKAANENDAIEKADQLLFASSDIDHNKILSVSRIS